MSLVVPPNFQHILRVLNTNIEGKTSVMFALTSIKGIGRRLVQLHLGSFSRLFTEANLMTFIIWELTVVHRQVCQHCAEEGRHPPFQEGW